MLWCCALSLPRVSRPIPQPCFRSRWISLRCTPRALERTLMRRLLTILHHGVTMVLTCKPWSLWAQFPYDPTSSNNPPPPHLPCTIHELEEKYTTPSKTKQRPDSFIMPVLHLLVRLNISCLISRLIATSRHCLRNMLDLDPALRCLYSLICLSS